jgi:hypothetical protein
MHPIQRLFIDANGLYHPFVFCFAANDTGLCRQDICSERLRCWRQFLHFMVYCSMPECYTANSFRITGSFDNPAGCVAALTCIFPYVFYFFRNSRRTVRYTSAVIASIVFITVVLSGSRAAIVACLVVSVCFLFSRYSGLKIKKTLIISETFDRLRH